MTNTINNTNNPLVILVCLITMALTALLRTAARLAGAAFYATGRTVGTLISNHWRLLALLALPVVAVVLVNLAWPVVVALAGKAIVGGGATMAFALVFRP